MRWSQLSDPVNLAEVVRSDLDNVITAKLVIVHRIVILLVILPADIVHVKLLVNLSDNQIENGNDISRIVLDLPVQQLIELEQVITVDIENVAVKLTDFLQLLDIVGCLCVLLIIFIIIVVVDLLEVVDEVFEFHLDFVRVDVGAPEHLRVRAHILSTLHHLAIVEHAS